MLGMTLLCQQKNKYDTIKMSFVLFFLVEVRGSTCSPKCQGQFSAAGGLFCYQFLHKAAANTVNSTTISSEERAMLI